MRTLTIGNYVVNTPLIDILKRIKSELTNGKLCRIELKDDWIRITCPKHSDGHEDNPSCGVYVGENTDKEYGYTHCFTCGLSSNFIECVSLCYDCSYAEAKDWLITNYGIQKEEVSYLTDLVSFDLPKVKKVEVLDENILDSFTSWHPYMTKRHLKENVCKEFKVKYDPSTECLVFPVYDENGRLTLLTKRSVNSKMFIIDKNKEKPVYLMYYIRDKGIKEITVCESQINTLTLWGWGIPSVATFGCNITSKQIEIFNKSGLTHIYLCYDGDTAGRHGIKRFLNKINKSILVDIILMSEGKDVNDLTEEEFNKLPIINGDDWIIKYGKGK